MNTQERRLKQRRKNRTGIKFPLVDERGCIVLFDRCRNEDRRIKQASDRCFDTKAVSGIPLAGTLCSEEKPDLIASPPELAGERGFSISGELVASVDNIYSSKTAGKWKVLELYRTPKGRYLCVEIWCTAMAGKYDQYWLTTCDDLKSAYEYFGNSSLANKLFDNVLCK